MKNNWYCFGRTKLILMFLFNLYFSILADDSMHSHCKMLSVDIPKFGEPIQNQTVAVGRESMFSCVVDNLQTYKVSLFCIAQKLFRTLLVGFAFQNNLLVINGFVIVGKLWRQRRFQQNEATSFMFSKVYEWSQMSFVETLYSSWFE